MVRLLSVPTLVAPPYWCEPFNTTSPTDYQGAPYLHDLHITRGKLGFSVSSEFFAGRRTLIEFPNSACNLINNPSSYSKTNSYCSDRFDAEIPFAACGFAKTSTADQDVYRGEMHVKHTDYIPVDDKVIERVIDTPFKIVVRLPKNIAVSSFLPFLAFLTCFRSR